MTKRLVVLPQILSEFYGSGNKKDKGSKWQGNEMEKTDIAM